MITNIIATVVVSVITNWTPIYESSFPNNMWCYDNVIYTPCSAAVEIGSDINVCPTFEIPQGKYLGKDGLVLEVTDLHFDYEGKPLIVRVSEKPLRKIKQREQVKTETVETIEEL